MEAKTYYLVIYNPETKEIAHQREVESAALVVDEVTDYPDKTASLLPYERNRYEMEATGRGLPWVLYCETVPFSWDNVLPKEAEE
jgi:hypothetical protein